MDPNSLPTDLALENHQVMWLVILGSVAAVWYLVRLRKLYMLQKHLTGQQTLSMVVVLVIIGFGAFIYGLSQIQDLFTWMATLSWYQGLALWLPMAIAGGYIFWPRTSRIEAAVRIGHHRPAFKRSNTSVGRYDKN